MKKNPIGKKFEKEYFSGYYFRNVGNFDKASLEKSKNWFWGWLSYLQKFVELKNGKGKSALEVGCSIGGVSHLLSDRKFEVYASDISSYAVEKAQKLAINKSILFKVFDVESGIPLDKKFDIIIAFEVIEHLKNPSRAILNMKKSLKKNGTLICSTPNLKYDLSYDPTHINVKSEKEWIEIFKRSGFKNLKVDQVSFLPFFYQFSKYFHLILPVRIKSRFINSPLFFVAKN